MRKTDPEFDQFVRAHMRDNSIRGQRIRYTRVRTAARRDERNDYYQIRGMIPEGNPHRDDIVARIFEDILSHALRREEIPARIEVYTAEFNRLFPTKYAKFGDRPLLSLDEVMFDGGIATRSDNVSQGLWG